MIAPSVITARPLDEASSSSPPELATNGPSAPNRVMNSRPTEYATSIPTYLGALATATAGNEKARISADDLIVYP